MYYMEGYYDAVVKSAYDWVEGNSTIKNADELAIICEHFKVNVPSYIRHFSYSDNPNHVCAWRAHKSLLNLLSRIQKKVVESKNKLVQE